MFPTYCFKSTVCIIIIIASLFIEDYILST